jgi:alpha-1,6-mannosyltransferase
MSRPLPNTYALIFCNLALAFWIKNKWEWVVVWLAFATIIFRCDIAVLAFSVIFILLNKFHIDIFI